MLDDNCKAQVLKALEARAVLFLGQRYLADRSGRSPVARALSGQAGDEPFLEWWLKTSQPLAQRAPPRRRLRASRFP